MSSLFGFRGLIMVPVFVFILMSSASAATFVVNTTADTQDATAGNGICADAGGACSLRAAITEANALAGADDITLPAGTYTITLTGAGENNNVSGDFDLNTEITINGAGSGTTIVQAAASRGVATERVFHLRAAFTMALNDMTVRYGRYTTAAGTFGAGVRIDVGAVNATLTNVVVTENDDGTSGGGIAVSGATNASLTLNNCTVSNNTAGGTAAGSSTGGGIMGNTTTATININNSTITGNTISNTSTTVSPIGGGISSIGTLNITNSMITNNTVTSSGFNTFSGGIHITAGTTMIMGSTISGNMSNVTGGTGSSFAGGIYNQQATLMITNSTVSGNSVSNTATPNSAFHAGIRTLSSTAVANTTLTNSTVSGNTAVGEGGGVVNISGGAANSTTNIIRSTVSGNMATGATSIGGGVENFNTSTGLATLNLTNSTVSGNSASEGAGIHNSGSALATVNLNFSTVAANNATTNGGGIFQSSIGSAVTNLKNSIVADNTAPTGPDIFGTITSQDYNHVENTSGGTFFTSSGQDSAKGNPEFLALANDVTGTDPQLGPLADNGGTTFTHLPGPTSPVKDTIPNGTNDCGTAVTVDQRNNVRPQIAGCDKGAVEILAPTAALASVQGRAVTIKGTGIRNTMVEISGGNLANPIRVYTNTFGYFKFNDLDVGQTYIITIKSKQYQFSNPTRVISLLDNISGFDFVGSEL